MPYIKIGDLTTFTGDTSGSWIVMNDETNAVTYKVQKETYFTSSLYGTASYALTASYVANASSFPYTGSAGISGSLNVVGPVQVTGNITASNALLTGTITAQTLVVQTITSSVEFVTGSTKFGSLSTDTHQFTGSVSITGSLTLATGVANLTASNALTASYVAASSVVGLNLSQISSGSVSASVNVNSASFQITSGSSTFLFVSNSGRVNIGTTSSTAALTIGGGSLVIGSGYGYGTTYGSTSDGIVQITDANASILGASYPTQIVLRQAGNVASQNSNYWGTIEQSTAGMLINSGRYLALYLRAGGGGVPTDTYFQAGTSTLMTIKGSTSNVLIGTTTDSGYKLLVATSGASGSLNVNNVLVVSGSSVQVTGSLTTTGSITALSGTARGVYFNNTLTASANSDTLVALDINSTFNTGSFTGVTNYALRAQDNVIVSKNQNAATSLEISNTTSGTASYSFLRLTSNSTAGFFDIGKYSGTKTSYKNISSGDSFIYNATSGDIAFLNDFASGKIKFAAGASSTQVTLFSNGNLAIGTITDSGYKLDVNGSGRFSSGLNVTGSLILSGSSHSITGSTSIDSTLYVSGSRVGIGKSNPDVSLDVVGLLNLRNTNTTPGSGYGIELATNSSLPRVDFVVNGSYVGQFSSNTTDVIFANNLNNSGGLYFSTVTGSVTTTRLRIFNNGNLAIGTTTDTGYKLLISGSGVSGSLNVNNVLVVSGSSVQVTGSFNISGSSHTISGSLNAANITGSLFGTSSWASNTTTAQSVAIPLSSGYTGYVEAGGADFRLRHSNSSTHININSNNTTTFYQVCTFTNGLRVSPGPNSPGLGFNANVGSYPATTIATFTSGSVTLLAVSGSGVFTNQALYVNDSLTISGSSRITGSVEVTGSLNANNVLYVSASNVGIGTNAPTTTLDISGTQRIVSNGSYSITHTRSGTTGVAQQMYNNGSTLYFGVQSSTNGNFLFANGSLAYAVSFGSGTNTATQFGTNNIIRQTIFNSGNVLFHNGGTPTDSGHKLAVSGSGASGSLNVDNILYVSSSTVQVSGSNSRLLVVGSGSANPLLSVIGSQGELFSVNDTLSGSLFSVNDISGLPVLEAFSDNRVLLGSYQAPAVYTTVKINSVAGNNTIYQNLPTASYDGMFVSYTARSGSSVKVGQITGMWSASAMLFNEFGTSSFGDVSGLGFTMIVTSGNMAVTASTSTANWSIKTIVRSI